MTVPDNGAFATLDEQSSSTKSSSDLATVGLGFSRSWMLAPALPVIGFQPLFEIVEPCCSPRHKRLVDPHVAFPFAGTGQVQAKAEGIVIDVWKFAAASELGEAGRHYQHSRRVASVKGDGHFVLATNGRRADAVRPRQSSCVQ